MLTVFLIVVTIITLLAAAGLGAASYFWAARNVLAVLVKVAKRREASMTREIRRLRSDNRFLVDQLLVRNGARALHAPDAVPPSHQPRKNHPVSPSEAIARVLEAEKTGPTLPTGQAPETVPPATKAKFLRDTTDILKQADAVTASAANGTSGGK